MLVERGKASKFEGKSLSQISLEGMWFVTARQRNSFTVCVTVLIITLTDVVKLISSIPL